MAPSKKPSGDQSGCQLLPGRATVTFRPANRAKPFTAKVQSTFQIEEYDRRASTQLSETLRDHMGVPCALSRMFERKFTQLSFSVQFREGSTLRFLPSWRHGRCSLRRVNKIVGRVYDGRAK